MAPTQATERSRRAATDAAASALGVSRRRGRVPPVDERLAPVESRIEYLHGSEIYAMPADRQHGTRHFDLTYVLGAHVARGYLGAVDMLTRTGEGTDIAPDASIFPEEPDPETGGRKLEVLAFEVTSKQRLSVPTSKARELVARGVRRVFCVLVKQRRVMEWSRQTDGWSPMEHGAHITDPCLAQPLPVRALLEAAEADAAVVRALAAKGTPALKEIEERAEARGKRQGERAGKREGRREASARAVLAVLAARRMAVPATARRRIQASRDLALLARWLARATICKSIGQLFATETQR